MIIHYISPSVFPSRSANAVHVAKQSDALTKYCEEVHCYACRSLFQSEIADRRIREEYALKSANLKFCTHFLPFNRFVTVFIALNSLLRLLLSPRSKVISRNLYASFVWGVILSRSLVFETHQLETGIGKLMQCLLIKKSNVTTVVISHKLREILQEYHGAIISTCLVLHDAADADNRCIDEKAKAKTLKQNCNINTKEWRTVCGYFGHLYAGRGIEIIVAMAEASPDTLFLVVGGTDADITRLRSQHSNLRNVQFLGFMPHRVAQLLMKAVDVLLMPYQKSVSIGVQGHDTGRWMSPMKMFEYMASGNPIISSNLEVLKEVLEDGENALLVEPDDISGWNAALSRLQNDNDLSEQISAQARRDYSAKYTWEKRAERLIEALQ